MHYWTYTYIYAHIFIHTQTYRLQAYIHTYIHIQVGLLPSELSKYTDSDSSKKHANDSLSLLNQMLWNASRDGDIAAITRCSKFGSDLNCVNKVCVYIYMCMYHVYVECVCGMVT